ncbi:hypothetical protein TNCT_725871, partial [Trichonephila clavata]
VVTPKTFKNDLIGKWTSVQLKWGPDCRGKLLLADAYMNLQVVTPKTFIDDLIGNCNYNIWQHCLPFPVAVCLLVHSYAV